MYLNNGILGGKILASENGDSSTTINTKQIQSLTISEINNYILSGFLASTIKFTKTTTGNISVFGDTTQILYDSTFESNAIYNHVSNNNEYYRKKEGYLVSIKVLDPLDEKNYNTEISFEITRKDKNDETKEVLLNPTSLGALSGDKIYFSSITDNSFEYITVNGTKIEDITKPIEVDNENIEIIIKPKEIVPTEITSVQIQYSEDNSTWQTINNQSTLTYDDNKTLYFNALITTNNGYYYKNTNIEWLKDGTSVSNSKNISINFDQSNDEALLYSVTLKVKDGFDDDLFESSINIQIEKGETCILPGTKILLGNNKYVDVETLKLNDIVKVFDFVTGTFINRKIAYFKEIFEAEVDVTRVMFDDGTYIDTNGGQSYFDIDKKEYFNIEYYDKKFINIKVLAYFNGKIGEKTIKDIIVYRKRTKLYEIVTEYNYNFVANGVVTVEPSLGSTNIFKINDDFKYDLPSMLNDINTYGLYKYEDVKDFMTEHQFEIYNVKYFKIAVGKGLTTFEEMRSIVEVLFKKYSVK